MQWSSGPLNKINMVIIQIKKRFAWFIQSKMFLEIINNLKNINKDGARKQSRTEQFIMPCHSRSDLYSGFRYAK